MIRTRTIGTLLLSLAAGPALAQSLPTLTAPVNDFAKVIDAASASEMDRQIRALETATHDAVVVVTVDTFKPFGSIQEYTMRLFERAGVGQKGKDNGLLIVLAVQDRRARIEPGYGLEEFITDGFAGETIRQEMLPAFREGKYGPGLLAGTARVIRRIAEGRGVTLAELPALARERQRGPSAGFPIIAAIVIFLILAAIARRRRGPPRFGGPWGGSTWSGWHGGIGGFGAGLGGFGGGFGGGGGGFGGFGGGRSGGGGASGGW